MTISNESRQSKARTGLSARTVLCLMLAGPMLFASDTVLTNGHIYTANSAGPWAEALAITGDKIDAVGSNAEIERHRTANTKVIDLQGKTVIPGVTDGHVHLWFGALALHGFNLSTPESNITSKDSALLLEKSRATPPPSQGPGDFRESQVHYRIHHRRHVLQEAGIDARASGSRGSGSSAGDSRYQRARFVGEPERRWIWPIFPTPRFRTRPSRQKFCATLTVTAAAS